MGMMGGPGGPGGMGGGRGGGGRWRMRGLAKNERFDMEIVLRVLRTLKPY